MPTKKPTPRVALVHDWLTSYRGGERVLEAIAELFPDAEIYTLFHVPGTYGSRLSQHPIRPSWLNRLPGVRHFYRYYLPLFPLGIESFDLSHYDLVISSSTCVAKGVIVGPSTRHVCYCNTTMRYIWDQYPQYFGKGVMRVLAAPIAHYLRIWDVTSSARVDRFIANSKYIESRIQKYYRRDSVVVHPFVDLDRFTPKTNAGGDFYLIVSALVPYKRLDLAIEAFNHLQKPLKIVGSGPMEKKLRATAGDTIEFLGPIRDAELASLYQRARALIFPGTEDFGITPLEAMASGTPVIAYGQGGVLETVVGGTTGLFFDEPTAQALSESVRVFERQESLFLPAQCRKRAEEFSKARFVREFKDAAELEMPRQTESSAPLTLRARAYEELPC